MEIKRIAENQYRVVENGKTSIMTLDEVMAALNRPILASPIAFGYDANEDFWREE